MSAPALNKLTPFWNSLCQEILFPPVLRLLQQFVHIQFSSVTQSCPVLCDPMDYSTPGFSAHQQIPESTQTHVYPISDAIQSSHPLSYPSHPTFNLSQRQGLFQWVSFSHRWPKYWRFSFSISLSNEYSGLISWRIDWLDLLAVQGTLKSLLQHHSSKASILRCSAFFVVKLSHPYVTTGKTIALTRWTFVGKVVSLLFNIEINEDFCFLKRKYAVFYVPKALLSRYSTGWDMWLL